MSADTPPSAVAGIARVDAAASEEDHLLHAVQVCGMHHVGLDHQVLIDELSPERVVGHDAADLGGT